ncbi:phosphoserine phosphatase serb [Choiromyces venosus 120613-1]|uniref:phosphoserine phosphatase n=1 Tax=Choiromyces venosus 120613-1 TaxID=1336337 RepID=A0A3N4JGQ2_9PEZI|nr:phosphoserine phosphatase serb [Choiromyces venosus 120613-1]
MSQTGLSNTPLTTPRQGLARAASYSAALHVRDLHGAPPTPNEDLTTPVEIITPEGKRVLIKNSGIVHTVSHKNCAPTKSALQLVATLFYNPNQSLITADGEEIDVEKHDVYFGLYISDMAMFEFIQTIDELLVPWKKWGTNHRCLDSAEQPKAMEISLSMPEMLQLSELRRHTSLWHFERKWNVELVLQENNIFRRYKRLAVFDMDSTLIEQEVIDEIAKFIGVEDQVTSITARAMNGEIDFTESLRQRVTLLKGVPSTVFQELKSVITFTPGARELCRVLKTLGYKLAVLSGGFIPLAEYVKEQLDFDYAHANNLVVSGDGKFLTGELSGPIVHAERKALLLEEIAKENGIALEQTMAIGDGANDLIMMKKAGLGIAFNAKPSVQIAAPTRLNSETMLDVLYILGFTKEEIQTLLAAAD